MLLYCYVYGWEDFFEVVVVFLMGDLMVCFDDEVVEYW